MKLSDIDDMNKVAQEYKRAKLFYDNLSKTAMTSMKMHHRDRVGVETFFELNDRNTYSNEFRIAFIENIKGYLDLLQTKLTLYGVEDFK